MKTALTIALALAAPACDSPGDRAASQRSDATTTASAADTSSARDSQGSTSDSDPTVAAVCERWTAARADRREGSWTGSTSTCEAGDVLEPGREHTLIQVNAYRALAGLPAVEHDDRKNAAAQDCALLMHANSAIEHEVPTNWDCYNARGAEAAGLSNLATTAGVTAVDLYMTDEDVASLGHRRWILSNSLGPIGIGSTSRYSCLHVIGGDGDAGKRWTAWPPPGVVPYDALEMGRFLSTDAAGWSLQSDAIDLRGAEVTVTRDGRELPVRVRTLDAYYGSTFGVGFTPNGWSTEAGATYHVSVRGLVEDLDWDVHVVACP